MEAMRETWTDARLSDFAAHTDSRFDAVDSRFEAVEHRFDAVDQRFGTVERRLTTVERRMDEGFRALKDRFDAFQRTMLQVGGGVIVALTGLIATQL
jgi:hypothetical protein